VDDFFKRLTCWKDDSKVEKKVQIVSKAIEVRRRPITASQAMKPDLISSYSMAASTHKAQGIRPDSAISKVTNRPLRSGRSIKMIDDNKSKHYLRVAKLRKLEEQRVLAES
jgi:hypothetical protein